MNTQNSKTNEPHRFRLSLANKLTLKDPSKNMALIYYTWKIIKSGYNNNKLKISAPTWNDGLMICLMDLIMLQTSKTTSNLSLRNTKLYLKLRLYQFTRIKSKTDSFQSKNRIQTIIFRNDETIRKYKKRF